MRDDLLLQIKGLVVVGLQLLFRLLHLKLGVKNFGRFEREDRDNWNEPLCWLCWPSIFGHVGLFHSNLVIPIAFVK